MRKDKVMVKKELAEAVDLTNKGQNVVFHFEQPFKDHEHGSLQLLSLHFGTNTLVQVSVPISKQVILAVYITSFRYGIDSILDLTKFLF